MGMFFILPFFVFISKSNLVLEFIVLSILLGVFYFLKSFSYFSFFYYFDMFSWGLILLSIFICSFMILSNLSFAFSNSVFNFTLSVFFMMLSLNLVFISSSVFLFYLFFEFSVIPIFFIICGLGFSFERLESGVYMFFYTLTFSLPFLLFIFIMFNKMKVIDFIVSFLYYYSFFDYFFVFFSVLMFFVKIPSFFLHLWLPKAHVEAPVSGSMILAGLLLKLGVYGLYIFIPFVFFQLELFSDLFFSWGLWGALISSFICFRQIDLKKMIAYMSIMHMGMVISSVFSFLFYSSYGIILMLLAHGLTSSGMFYSLNCFYERVFSRSLLMVSGGMYYFTNLFFWFTVVVSSNISLPPSFNFFSELILVFSILHYHISTCFYLFLLIFMGSLVSFHILVSMMHGFTLLGSSLEDINLKEMIILGCHMMPIYFLFLFL